MSDSENFKKFIKGLVKKKPENKLDKKAQRLYAFESEQLHQLYALSTAAHAVLVELRKLLLQYRNVDFDSGVFINRDFTTAWRFIVCVPSIDGHYHTFRDLMHGSNNPLDGMDVSEDEMGDELPNGLRAKGQKPLVQSFLSDLIKLNEEYDQRPITTFNFENPTEAGDTSWVTSLLLMTSRFCASLTSMMLGSRFEMIGAPPAPRFTNKLRLTTRVVQEINLDLKNPDFMSFATILPMYFDTTSQLLVARGRKGFDKLDFATAAYRTHFLRAGIGLISINELIAVIGELYTKLIVYVNSVLKEMPEIIEEHLALGEPAFKKWDVKDDDRP